MNCALGPQADLLQLLYFSIFAPQNPQLPPQHAHINGTYLENIKILGKNQLSPKP